MQCCWLKITALSRQCSELARACVYGQKIDVAYACLNACAHKLSNMMRTGLCDCGVIGCARCEQSVPIPMEMRFCQYCIVQVKTPVSIDCDWHEMILFRLHFLFFIAFYFPILPISFGWKINYKNITSIC